MNYGRLLANRAGPRGRSIAAPLTTIPVTATTATKSRDSELVPIGLELAVEVTAEVPLSPLLDDERARFASRTGGEPSKSLAASR